MSKRRKPGWGKTAGFTLVEMLIAVLMASIIGVAIFNTTRTQQDTFVAQDSVAAAQQNLRAALLLMTREIRMAGCDPTGRAGAGITAASSSSLSFTSDLNGDGDTADSGENLTYTLYTPADGIQKLGRRNPTATMPVAEYIANLEFLYLLANGSTTTAPASSQYDDIVAVRVTVLARAPTADAKLQDALSFTTPGGSTWTLPTGVRGRLASVTIRCRNLGL